MEGRAFTPSSAAILLTHWLDAAEAGGLDRFPIKVNELALHVGQTLKWSDPIFEVRGADIPTFEGGLFHVEGRGWALLFNEKLKSPGRIRFTQAHELGHYLLHRLEQESFECSQADMVHWGTEHRVKESQADEFASNLLMPLRQFRGCFSSEGVDFEMMSDASSKFGVSMTAAALRWIQQTPQSAVLVLSRDGFMDWSVSSEKARANGAFFRTRNRVVALPHQSIAVAESVDSCRAGEPVALKTWFEHAHPDAVAREMKLVCENYGYTLSLIHLSPGDKVWEPKRWED
jgi:IrrE N-terminal-like domain